PATRFRVGLPGRSPAPGDQLERGVMGLRPAPPEDGGDHAGQEQQAEHQGVQRDRPGGRQRQLVVRRVPHPEALVRGGLRGGAGGGGGTRCGGGHEYPRAGGGWTPRSLHHSRTAGAPASAKGSSVGPPSRGGPAYLHSLTYRVSLVRLGSADLQNTAPT